MVASEPLAVALRGHLTQLVADLGFSTFLPQAALDAALTDLELGVGQLLADVERAQRRNIPLRVAVHDDGFPYLARFHGHLHDAFVMEVPSELVPILRRLVRMPSPQWSQELLDDMCIVARSPRARPDERALARLVIFEGVRVNLFVAAWRTDGGFEGIGGSRRDLDDIADAELARLLAIPLAEDATERYRPFATTVASALVRLRDHVDALWAAQALIEDLRKECEGRARLEMLLRRADPVDAVVLRNQLDRSPRQQPVPVARLPFEHPLLLDGHTEHSLNQRSSRATRTLDRNPARLVRRPKPITFIDLLLEPETSHA